MLSISILICTYNPDEQIFRRTLKSVESLILREDIPVECIIVDNNSTLPVSQLIFVREFLDRCPWVRVIQEVQQGLTFARVAGFRASNNECIVFIDDDNEVSASYVEVLADLFTKYLSVCAWGPGTVNVEFMDNVSEWFSNTFKHLFQERQAKYNQYGCLPETWASFYPFGTGLAVRREVLARYCDEVESGNLSAVDRKGKSLSSGGDMQIVWEGIKMGYAAGVAPKLAVNHLIPSSRSNLEYIKRLSFGTADTYYPCFNDSFPEMKSSIVADMPSSYLIVKSVFRKIVAHFIKLKLRLLKIDLAQYLGATSGFYQVAQKNNLIVDFMIEKLRLR
jgi:glycosyltransferase involved in cell wall biosynthesis